ncbi:MAG: biotin carboxylase N-terminal domain-containing protein [Acidimicrobiia bacterium]
MISRLLIANRGEIARRIIRTCRSLGIETVAVHSDADADMPFVAEADLAVRLPGNAPADTYLRIDFLVDAAKWTGCDAVHPGYGFLSESATFARAVIDAGLVWVGPPPAAIESMGSKIVAKDRMRAANVPVLRDALVSGLDRAELLAAGERVGFPLLVKASAGGGGRGMRVVRHVDDLEDAVLSASREAEAAFGDGTLFLERYVDGGRHVEIQVFADTQGNCVSLFERECSIQRRHQKIIEESPSPAVSRALRAAMGDAAVAAARAVGYSGAGTVEFLLDDEGEFAFLEMNTRLQVEHPVTELVTGLDLVALQLAVAEGRPLPPEALQPWLRGHAVEARLYAEDPALGHRPHTGRLDTFEVPSGPNVRVDSGVVAGSVVSPFYDPMLAKVIAWGHTRDDAVRTLTAALAGARIHGLETNREQLVSVLRHPEFLAGRIDTQFLDRHPCSARAAPSAGALAAAALALQAAERDAAAVLPHAPSGWRNLPSAPQTTTLGGHEVGYRLDRDGRTLAELTVDGETLDAAVVDCTPHRVTLRVAGVRRSYSTVNTGDFVHVDSLEGSWSLPVLPRFPLPDEAGLAGSLVAPMPGSIVRIAAGVGASVVPGQLVMVIEAMKMEHDIVAPAAGVVTELMVAAGQQVDAGQVLLVLSTEPAA